MLALASLRDRLSKSKAGYSFITGPANQLEDEYLLLMERACLYTTNGLVRKGFAVFAN